jgi:RNA polymerase sigma factor (sigma-70 family)
MTSGEWHQLLTTLEQALGPQAEGAPPSAAGERAWKTLRRQTEEAARLYVSRDDLDDVVQNVLVKLLSPDARRRLRAARAPARYLTVMVRNAATDLIRRRAARVPDPDRLEASRTEGDLLIQRLDAEQRAAALRQAIASLSDAERLLLRLRFWDDLSIAEIAGRLGMRYSAVAVRLFRAQRRLRSALGGLP